MLELRQLVGKTADGVEIAHETDRVFFGGEYVGIIDRRDHANMCLVKYLSAPDRKQLETALIKARKEAGYQGTPEVHGNPLNPALVAKFLDSEADE